MRKQRELIQAPTTQRGSFWSSDTICGFLFCVVLLTTSSLLAQGPKSRDEPGSLSVRNGIVHPRTTHGPVYSRVPELTPEQRKIQEAELNEVNRLPPLRGDRVNALPLSPPTEVNRQESLLRVERPQAPNDFVYNTIHDLTSAEASSSRATIGEPSVANVGDTIFYSGNWYAARSFDGGDSFTYVSPYTTFPSINGGFCCDQVINYAPNQNMILWALQYVKDATSGTLRIARVVGDSALASNTWTFYDFNPQNLGFGAGNWLDFPNITVSDNYLYLTSNVFSTTTGNFTGCVIWRVSLADLAAGADPLNYSRISPITDVSSIRCTEGAHTTIYCGTLVDMTQVRIYRWPDSGSPTSNDVTVSSFNYLSRDGVATSPDGTNWAARADSRILGSWVAGGVIGLMWPAKQGGTFPYPYTIVARFNESNRALINQTPIWNSQFAWLYPTASINAAGNIAGLLTAGGGTYYPTTNIFISDDVENGFAPLALYPAMSSDTGPTSNAWGDYQTVRRHKHSPNTWVASTHGLTSANAVVPRYLWFGRERDFVAGVTLSSAVSRKMHAGAGTFDINLPVNGGPRGVECRSGGASGDYQLVFAFSNPLMSVAGASVISGTGSVPGNQGAIGSNTQQYIVNLTGVTNAQYLTVKLSDVRDNAAHISDVSQEIGFLLGDTSANGAVNASDVSQTKAQSGNAVTASNFRTDVTATGAINSSDVSSVKAKSGTALPSAP